MAKVNCIVPGTAGKNHQNKAKDNALEDKKMSVTMSEEEIIRENIKEIFEKKSREERRANGRLIAVIVAFLVIFLALYHAYVRKSAALAGVLVPAAIMLSYGGWVVLLAKRDKQRRALFEKHLEEVAVKNKHEIETKIRTKHKRKKSNNNETTLHFEDEGNRNECETKSSIILGNAPIVEQRKHHRKHHRQRRTEAGGNSSNSSISTRQKSSHHATKDLRVKRRSLRQKLFSKSAANAVVIASSRCEFKMQPPLKRRLQRSNALAVPQLIRIASAP